MLHPQLIALTELVESLESEAAVLSRTQLHGRLTSLLQATARLQGSADAKDDIDIDIDRLVLRACNAALSAMYPAADTVAVEMVGSDEGAESERV